MNRCIHPQDLSNGQLLQRVEFLASRSKRDLAELLWHLAEVDARGLYRDQACSSMFTYCTDRLGFSESVAYKRITAARLARKFPAILRSVAKGEVTLSGVKSLAKVLTVENHERVLKAAIGKKTRDVEMLAAELAPKPDAPAQIRKLPTSASESTSEAPDASARAPSASGNLSSEMPLFAVVAAAAPPRSQSSHSDGSTRAARGSVAPLRADRFKVQFSASVELRNKLARAEELLGPMYGGGVARGDIASVVARALDELTTVVEKRRFAKTSRSAGSASRRCAKHSPQRKSQARKAGTRYIPREVRREVAERDGARCTFVDDVGGKRRRCEERRALEFHHERAFARGGDATVENIRLLCRGHNALLAERDFGAEHMERAKQSARIRSRSEQPLDARPSSSSSVCGGDLL